MLDVRSEIFRLRQQNPPLSHAAIAGQLGISKSRVQRELNKSARGAGGLGEGGVTGQTSEPARQVDHVLAGDPEVQERRRAVELARLRTQELDAEARQVEAMSRLEVLKNPGGGQSQLAAVLLSELREIRSQVARPAAGPPAAPPPSLTDELQRIRSMSEIVKSFAPATPPSSSSELEFKVAMQRLDFENQRIAKQFEQDLEVRRELADSQRGRDEAVAKAIEQFAPVLAIALERWVNPPTPEPAVYPAPSVLQGGRSEEPVQQPAGQSEVQGQCPRCGQALAMTPGGEADTCPACGVPLLVANGVIGLRESPAPAAVKSYAS